MALRFYKLDDLLLQYPTSIEKRIITGCRLVGLRNRREHVRTAFPNPFIFMSALPEAR